MASAPGGFFFRKVFAPQKLSSAPQTEQVKIYARFLHPARKTCVYMRKTLDRLILIKIIITMVEEDLKYHSPRCALHS